MVSRVRPSCLMGDRWALCMSGATAAHTWTGCVICVCSCLQVTTRWCLTLCSTWEAGVYQQQCQGVCHTHVPALCEACECVPMLHLLHNMPNAVFCKAAATALQAVHCHTVGSRCCAGLVPRCGLHAQRSCLLAAHRDNQVHMFDNTLFRGCLRIMAWVLLAEWPFLQCKASVSFAQHGNEAHLTCDTSCCGNQP